MSRLFTNVLAKDETDGTRGKPIFQKFILRRTNCQNQNLASKVVFLGFFLFVPPQYLAHYAWDIYENFAG